MIPNSASSAVPEWDQGPVVARGAAGPVRARGDAPWLPAVAGAGPKGPELSCQPRVPNKKTKWSSSCATTLPASGTPCAGTAVRLAERWVGFATTNPRTLHPQVQ